MNIEPKPDIDNQDTFESVLTQLSERIRNSRWVKSELDAIVEDALELARNIDTSYYNDGSFTRYNLYLLYQVVVEVWSYQHQAILENLKLGQNQQLKNYVPLVFHHSSVLRKMFHNLDGLDNVNDIESLRNGWLLIWKETLYDLAEFVTQVPRVSSTKVKKSNEFRSRKISSSISPNSKYVLLSTFLLVLGILIATLLLISQ
jgi:hypothetical protein